MGEDGEPGIPAGLTSLSEAEPVPMRVAESLVVPETPGRVAGWAEESSKLLEGNFMAIGEATTGASAGLRPSEDTEPEEEQADGGEEPGLDLEAAEALMAATADRYDSDEERIDICRDEDWPLLRDAWEGVRTCGEVSTTLLRRGWIQVPGFVNTTPDDDGESQVVRARVHPDYLDDRGGPTIWVEIAGWDLKHNNIDVWDDKNATVGFYSKKGNAVFELDCGDRCFMFYDSDNDGCSPDCRGLIRDYLKSKSTSGSASSKASK